MELRAIAFAVSLAKCHGQASDEKKQKEFARHMMAITARANAMIDGKDDGAVTCWTCHHGDKKPAQKP